MNYRQWKKNYKKNYGVNPPLNIDKRKQRKLAVKVTELSKASNNIAESIKDTVANFMRAIAKASDGIATGFRDVANRIQPLDIEGCYLNWEVKPVINGYGIYENNSLTGSGQLKLITNSRSAAEKVVEIMKVDQLEYTDVTIQREYRDRAISHSVKIQDTCQRDKEDKEVRYMVFSVCKKNIIENCRMLLIILSVR